MVTGLWLQVRVYRHMVTGIRLQMYGDKVPSENRQILAARRVTTCHRNL